MTPSILTRAGLFIWSYGLGHFLWHKNDLRQDTTRPSIASLFLFFSCFFWPFRDLGVNASRAGRVTVRETNISKVSWENYKVFLLPAVGLSGLPISESLFGARSFSIMHSCALGIEWNNCTCVTWSCLRWKNDCLPPNSQSVLDREEGQIIERGGNAEIAGIASLTLTGDFVGCSFLWPTHNCFVEKHFLKGAGVPRNDGCPFFHLL